MTWRRGRSDLRTSNSCRPTLLVQAFEELTCDRNTASDLVPKTLLLTAPHLDSNMRPGPPVPQPVDREIVKQAVNDPHEDAYEDL
ncbi:hypothetical protein GCM10010442_39220 [Kitasatospora kifunensis]